MKKLTIRMHRYEWILGLIYMVAQLTVLPYILTLVNSYLRLSMNTAELNFAYFAINFLCITVIFHKYLIACTRTALSQYKCVLTAYGIGFGLYWAGNILVNILIFQVNPEFTNANDSSIAGMLDQNNILMMVGAILLVPPVEEVLYRGILFDRLYNRWPIAAYVVSTVIFASLHVVGYITSYSPMHLALCFLQYIPAGIALGWAYAHSGTIWAPILIHTTVNLIGMLAM